MNPESPQPQTEKPDQPLSGENRAPQPTVASPTKDQNTAYTGSAQSTHQVSNQTMGDSSTASNSNALVLVLQWLTYAFWGWAVLMLSYITTNVVSKFIYADYEAGVPTYFLAALIVLLPVAFICDSFYSKQEPEKKTGASLAIMVIHAVIFALFCIGALIAAVFSIVTLFTNDGLGDNKASYVGLVSALIIFFYYALTFLRTIKPPQLPVLRNFYRFGMSITVGIMVFLGFV